MVPARRNSIIATNANASTLAATTTNMLYRIKIIDENKLETFAYVIIELLEAPNCHVILTLENGEKFDAVDTDSFRALLKIREQTEPRGIKFLIQGCKPSCWPSGMSVSMSNGTKIYHRQLILSSDPLLVNTFDYAPEHEIGTLQDQDNFNKEWRRMLKAGG